MKELETEIGLDIFLRSNRGIVITPEGEEFLGYARQVTEQFGLLQSKYIDKKVKEKFSVSTQHYTFAVKAFVETVKQIGMEQYEFAVHETTTSPLAYSSIDIVSVGTLLSASDFRIPIPDSTHLPDITILVCAHSGIAHPISPCWYAIYSGIAYPISASWYAIYPGVSY